MPGATMVSSSSLATASWWLASWPAASSPACFLAGASSLLLGRSFFRALGDRLLDCLLGGLLVRRLLRSFGGDARRRRRGRHPLQRHLAPTWGHGGADHRVQAPGGQRGGHIGRRPDGAEHSDDVPAGPAGHRDGHRHGHVVGLDAVGQDGPVPGDDRGGRHRLAVGAHHLPSPVEPEQQAPSGVGHRVVDDDHHDIDRTGKPCDHARRYRLRAPPPPPSRPGSGRLAERPAGPPPEPWRRRRAPSPTRGRAASSRRASLRRTPPPRRRRPARPQVVRPRPAPRPRRRRPSRRAAPRRRGEERRAASACPSRPGAAVARRSPHPGPRSAGRARRARRRSASCPQACPPGRPTRRRRGSARRPARP